MRVLLYYTLLLLVTAYALTRGGWSERTAALVLLAGSLLTDLAFVPGVPHFVGVEKGVFAADLATLAGFVFVALKSDRYWPLWIAAIQLIGVLAHFARLLDPDMMRTGYAVLLAFWAYPMLALIALGTRSHQLRIRRTSSS